MTFNESLFLVFIAAALASSAALFMRQPLLVVYIATGCVLGPHVLDLAGDSAVMEEIGTVGIVLLLMLIGLDLPPHKLRNVFRRSMITAVASSTLFFGIGFGGMLVFEFSLAECVIGGIAVSFSSTVMVVKLLPVRVLHHRHIGELAISLLLLQDVLAIVALLAIEAMKGSGPGFSLVQSLIAFPALAIAALVGVRWIVVPLLNRFDSFAEYVFLLALGWCLGVASLAHLSGLSHEIGAFIAGVTLANHRVAQYLAQVLQPLRDFFLVLFFFSVGASLDPVLFVKVVAPVLILASALLFAKPLTFYFLLRIEGENRGTSRETGVRLGQCSEFSLLVVAASGALLSAEGSTLLRGVTILTILVSTYIVVAKFQNPMAFRTELRSE